MNGGVEMHAQIEQTHGQTAVSSVSHVKHLITMLMGMWLIVGIFIDGFAHNHGVVESFFTPWHAILYSGYLACAVWILILTYQNKLKEGHASWFAAIPAGYMLGAIGVSVFFVGGICDMIWHIVFGIEENIDALLSPTHLILLTGGLLILTSPYRALTQSERNKSPTFRQLLPALASIALTFSVMAFFLMYAWSFRNPLWMARDEDAIARAIVDFLITTMLLMVPVMFTLRRWKLPFGTVTFFFTIEAFLMGILDGLQDIGTITILVISGIVGDLLFRQIRVNNPSAWQYRAIFFFVPVLIWSLYFAGLGFNGQQYWAPELWGGAIFLSGLCSLGLSIVATPIVRGEDEEN
jgi:hypothetical protein